MAGIADWRERRYAANVKDYGEAEALRLEGGAAPGTLNMDGSNAGDYSNLPAGTAVQTNSANPYYQTGYVDENGGISIPPQFPGSPAASSGGKENVVSSEPPERTDMTGDQIFIPEGGKTDRDTWSTEPPEVDLGADPKTWGGVNGTIGPYNPADRTDTVPITGTNYHWNSQMMSTDTVAPEETEKYESVFDLLNQYLDEDSPYMQAAVSRANEEMAARGLLNSSIGVGAAQRAAIESALPIAQQDSQQSYGWQLSEKEFNQDAALLATEYNRKWNEANLNIEGNLANTALQNKGNVDIQKLKNQSAWDLGQLEAKNRIDVQRLANQGQIDVQKLRNKGAIDVEKVRGANQVNAINIQAKYDKEARGEQVAQNYINAQDEVVDTWNAEVISIQQSEGLTPEQKEIAIADAGDRATTQLAANDQIYGDAYDDYGMGDLPEFDSGGIEEYTDSKQSGGEG